MLEDPSVHYFLQPIGIVVADTLERATHAAELVRTRYQETPAVAGLTAHLAEYHLPTNADVPEIDVIFVDEEDRHINPLGVKGVGETGVVGAPAAIANAVFHATGVRVRELPITPDKLLATTGEAGRSARPGRHRTATASALVPRLLVLKAGV